MISKIIFLMESYFNESYYQQFGIDMLIENGLEVEVWDFTPFVASAAYCITKVPDPVQWEGYKIFRNKTDAVSAILSLDKNTYIVNFVHYNLRTFCLFKALSSIDIPYCVPGFALPVSSSSSRILVKRLKTFSFFKLIPYIFRKIPYGWFGIKPADMVLAWAKEYRLSGLLASDNSKILWVHSYDYDTYLRKKLFSCEVQKNLGVFLDMYLPFHPDMSYLGLSNTIAPGEYYPLICKFFEHLEHEYGVQIIIAAHPRANYEEMPDYFGGRPVVRGQTGDLVRKAGFVILHNSVSINYAVLFKKPMIFITMNKLNNGLIEDPSITWLANYFGKKAHNLDEDIDINFSTELTLDDVLYSNFKNNFIKKDDSEELLFWQIFLNYIRNVP